MERLDQGSQGWPKGGISHVLFVKAVGPHSSIQLMLPDVGRVATTEFRKFVNETNASMVVATLGIDIFTSSANAKKPILSCQHRQ